MKQAIFSRIFSFAAAALFSIASFGAAAHPAQSPALQSSPPVLCVIDGCNDPYPGPQR